MGAWIQAAGAVIAAVGAVLLGRAIHNSFQSSLNANKVEILNAINELKTWADGRYELKEVARERTEALHQRLTDLHGKRAHGSGD